MTKIKYPHNPVLLVDDETSILQTFEIVLRTAGINHLMTCSDSRQVADLLEETPVELLLLDLTMPHCSGEEVLEHVHTKYPDLPVIIITGLNDVETAVNCMQLGAFDYMVKPVEKNRLVSGVKHALQVKGLQQESVEFRDRVLSDSLEQPEAFSEIITKNKQMRILFQYVESVATSPEPVLVTGETGVGKDLFARAIHRVSGRTGDYVAVNVAGLDEQVFSDTLFGHRKGAFTGAAEHRAGLVEKAADGTLFLDEIGDLQPAAQVKLLRLLQEREYMPVGSDVVKRTNARVVASTNQDLEELMQDGRFRRDLYYRLHAHHMVIPPLRQRLDDLPLLVEHFMAQSAQRQGKTIPCAPPEMLDYLRVHPFPGNVRELQALIIDAVSRHKGHKLSLQPIRDHIGDRPSVRNPNAPLDMPSETGEFMTLQEMTEHWVTKAMNKAGGNQTLAARLLGISQPALSKRLKKMGEK